MSYNLNRVQLIGRLGNSPEFRTTENKKELVSFSLATNKALPKNKDDQKAPGERVTWHHCVAWGKTATVAQKLLSKGQMAFVEGELNTHTWEDEQKNKHLKCEIVVRDLIPLGKSDKE